MRRAAGLVLLLTLLIAAGGGVAQEELSADWFVSEARRAIRLDQYRRAVELLEDAEERYPDTRQFPIILGDLYFDQELFGLALEAYQRAEAIAPENYVLLHQLGATLSRLNREAEAIDYYERLRSLFPDDSEAFPRLGWLYFKTHRLERAEAVLLEGLELYPDDRLIVMTLATAYAAMYDYERSEEYYTRSIHLAEAAGDDNFAALAYYNLSLLEREFHNFDRALEYTNRSIARAPRASGYLARGELMEMNMSLEAAEEDYNRAFSIDEDTPFARIRLADLYRRIGRLDTALRIAEEVFAEENLSWIYGFGIDVERHFMDMHELLGDIYDALHNRARHRAIASLGERIGNAVDRLRYRIAAWYHRTRFAYFANRVADAFRAAGNRLDAAATYFDATSGYPDIALRHLGEAAALEVPLIPDTRGSYLLEEGRLRDSPEVLSRALGELDPEWQRDDIEEGRLELIRLFLAEGRTAEALDLIDAVYEVNRGAFRRSDIEVPIRLLFAADDSGTISEEDIRLLRDYLGDVGLRVTAEGPVAGIQVSIASGGSVVYSVQREGEVLASGSGMISGDRRAAFAALAEAIAEKALAM